MNIAGVVVHARPGQGELVEKRLVEIPGVEVHARTEDHRMIVTVEEQGDNFVADTLVRLDRVEGVLSAAMVYQHCEAIEEATE